MAIGYNGSGRGLRPDTDTDIVHVIKGQRLFEGFLREFGSEGSV